MELMMSWCARERARNSAGRSGSMPKGGVEIRAVNE
jgi:hypothetical protein